MKPNRVALIWCSACAVCHAFGEQCRPRPEPRRPAPAKLTTPSAEDEEIIPVALLNIEPVLES